ncbi:MAG: OmpA family protein [Weeksellaceae bacterium]
MKKVTFVLAILALVSCKFDQTGNKNIIPENPDHELEEVNVMTEDAMGEEEEMTDAAEGKLDEHGNYIYNVGDLMTITLPDGKKLEVGANSTENKLFTMLSNEGFEINHDDKTQGWVTLDRVYFETGSDGLTATSMKQIENIVTILNAYPNAKVKLGGYTDNTGSQDINQPLSEGRAKAVMNNIVKNGINAERLAAEGYGADHPVCPANDTDMCKAQNRRVDVRLTEK